MKGKIEIQGKVSTLFMALLYMVSASATDVGTPKGSFAVSPTGGSVYSVDIEVPTGIRGMQPSIAITYNSQSGPGIAGYGCNVSGISVITRVPKDAYHDSTMVKGIAFDNTDAFCLDGKRLLFKSGTEGTEGAVYSPEGEPFTDVVMHTSTYKSSSGIWFEVKTCDGITYQYGTSFNNFMVVNVGGIYYQNAWYIARSEDQLGNYITYSYLSDNYYLYPSQIVYGLNSNGGGTSNYIDFTYEDNPNDQQSFYVKGTKVTIGKRLTNITTSHGNSIYRTYDFSYTNMTMGNRIFSALYTITEKNGDNNALNPIRYTWNSSYGNTQSVSQPAVPLEQSSSLVEIESSNFIAADLNGDGFGDIAQISPVRINYVGGYYECSTYLFIYRSYFDNDSQTISYLPSIMFDLGPSFDMGEFSMKLNLPTIFDYDGDGLNDIIIPSISTIDHFGIMLSQYFVITGEDIKSGYMQSSRVLSTQLSSSELPLYTTSDVDNDGLDNLVTLDRNGVNNIYNLTVVGHNSQREPIPHTDISVSLPSSPKEIISADFNNNGLKDLMIIYDGGYRILWNLIGTGSSTPYTSSSYTQGTTVSYQSNLEIGDFNGDGTTDILIGTKNSSAWHIAYGKGDGTFTNQQAGTFEIYDQSTDKDDNKMRCMVYDFDGDGRSDVVIEKAVYSSVIGTPFIQTKALWLRSTGTGLTLVKTATSQTEDDGLASHYMLCDFTGNGRTELMNYGYNCYSGNNANVSPTLNLYTLSSFTAQSGKVTTIKDGLDNQTTITFGSLINSGKYTPQSDAVIPMADVSLPLNVVTGTVQTNGAADNISLGYEYGGLKAHLRGKGLLGFSKTKTIDLTSSDSTKTILNNWDSQFFIPKNTLTTLHRGNACETSSSTVTVVAKGNGNFFAYPSSHASTDMYGNTTTLTKQFNTTYGYITSEKVSNGTNMYRRTAYSSYIKKGLVWLPRTVTYTQKHADDSSVYTDVTTYTYNNKGLKTQAVAHQNVSDKTITTNYTYDTAGNVLSEASTGIGVPNITYYYTYSSNKRDLTRTYTSPATTNVYYTYNAWGNLVNEQDRTNTSGYLTTTYTYDGWGRKTSETSPTGIVTNYSTGWGNSQSKKFYTYEKTQGRAAHYTWYDACGREVCDSVWLLKGALQTHTTTYDSKGRVSSTINSIEQASRTVNYNYDQYDRVLTRATSYEGSTSYTYGNRTVNAVKDGHTYTKTYDAWGNVKYSSDPQSSVTYTYKSNGKPESITTNGSTVTMGYDAVGNQTSLSDPDAGLTTYTYDAAGHLLTLTDARNKVTETTYDNLGRVNTVVIDGVTTSYTYGTSGNEILKLVREQCGNNIIQYTHDAYGRLLTEQRTIAGSDNLTFTYSYNSNDQISQIVYPGSLTVGYNYDDYGYRTGMTIDGSNIWSVTSYNGNALETKLLDRSTYVFMDGANRVYAKANGNRVLGFNYSNLTGNLSSRLGVAGNLVTENFTYDSLDRLTGVTVPASSASSLAFLESLFGEDSSAILQRYEEPLERMVRDVSENALSVTSVQAPMTITYGANGNITFKTGIGDYLYPNSNALHPHAVTSVSNTSGFISTALQTITYNGFGKVANISDNGYTMSFTYGPDQERWKTILKQNGTTKRTTIYAGNYEKITENNVTREIYYLDDDIICMKINHGLPVFYKGWTDNLGSYIQLIDNTGTSQFEAQYDAWGRQEITKNNVGFHRGFTGHEMLPEFGLINMNGRLYNPLLGRFLSPDNFVQLPDFSQSFNRYSYCLNNPLKYTDPSGELFGIDDAFIAFTLISSAMMGYAQASLDGGNAWLGALKGFANGVLSLVGTAGIGAAFGHSVGSFGNELLRAGAHGLNNGLISTINGNGFGTGFITGSVASLAGSGAQALNLGSLGTIASTTGAGALGSYISGGNWFEGAMAGFNIGTLNHLGDDDDVAFEGYIPELVVTPHGTRQLYETRILEKPLKIIFPEFGLLLGIRGIINTLSLLKSPQLKYSEHVLEQMSSRGYTKEDIIEIMQKGNKTTGYSKYGVKQFRYNYYDNIVVQNVGDKKIVTVFSNAPASSPHVKGYKIPWK